MSLLGALRHSLLCIFMIVMLNVANAVSAVIRVCVSVRFDFIDCACVWFTSVNLIRLTVDRRPSDAQTHTQKHTTATRENREMNLFTNSNAIAEIGCRLEKL